MDYISTVKKDNKEYCLGGTYYNIVLNKGDTIGSILDQIPDFNPDLGEVYYPVLWSGNIFNLSFGKLDYQKSSKGYKIEIYGALSQGLAITFPKFGSLEQLRNFVIEDEALEAANRMPMVLSDIPEDELGDKSWYNVVFRDGHIMFDFSREDGGK